MPTPPQRPDLPRSNEVRISPSKAEGGDSSTGPDHWIRRGFELKEVLAEIQGTSPNRLELTAALDNGTRYDFILVPPQNEDDEAMKRQVLEGIQKYFHITVAPTVRPMDVYVMTVVNGKTPPRKSEEEAMGGSVGAVSVSIEVPHALQVPENTPRTRKAAEEATRRVMDSPEFRQAMETAQLIGASAFSSTVDEFCRELERGLHHPVINETGLTGYYDFKIQGTAKTTDEFFRTMRDQLGLVLTATQRAVEMITAK